MTPIKYILFLLFALSGFAGLIYESIWTQYIKLILGHAAYAQTLVLIIFMGGMALGALLISRISNQISNPLLWYAALEALIGLFGIVFHQEFLWFQEQLFSHALPAANSAIMADLIKWLFATFLLLPQAILLGATFPLMSSAIIRLDNQHSGHTLSTLYFTNSIGAAIGVIVSGFLLINIVGLPGTVLTAGFINISLALVVWLLTKVVTPKPAAATVATQTNSPEKVLLIVALLTGTASFFYEIGWIRMLSLVLGSSVQAFELMLSAFIAGLAFGSFFIRRKLDSLKRPWLYLVWIQVIMGILATATLPLYTSSFSFMSFLIQALTKTDSGYSIFLFSSHLIAFAVMLPATFMAGMTLPILTNMLLKSAASESAIGKIYSANTIGAIIGIVLAVNLLIPLIGVKGLIVMGGMIDLGLGILLLWKFAPGFFSNYRLMLPVASGFIAIIVFSLTPFDKSTLSSGVYRTGIKTIQSNADVTFYQDGKTSTVSVIDHLKGGKSIHTNGKPDATISPSNLEPSPDEITMVMLGALPLALHPESKTVANIGMGSGLSTHILLASKKIQQIDTIEIESNMVKGAQQFGDRVSRTFNDPRSHIYIDDAKSFFSTQQKRYDIIVSEPSNPWVNGVASLFTHEFYDNIQPYLNENGIFVQWLQLYEIDLDNITTVFKALNKSFKTVRIYNTTDNDLIIVASNNNPIDKIDSELMNNATLKPELLRVGIESVEDLKVRYVGDKRVITPFLISPNLPVNSDFFPYLSHNAPKSRFKKENADSISNLHSNHVPVLSWLNGNNISGKLSEKGKFFQMYPNYRQAKTLVSNNGTQLRNLNLVFATELVNSIENLCGKHQIRQNTIIDSLMFIASAINSFLPIKELDKYWNKLMAHCNSKQANPIVERWLQLHRAISQRNAEHTLKIATQIHTDDKNLNDSQRRYLTTATLTAYIAEQKFKQAWQYIEQLDLVKKQGKEPLVIKMLISIAATGLEI